MEHWILRKTKLFQTMDNCWGKLLKMIGEGELGRPPNMAFTVVRSFRSSALNLVKSLLFTTEKGLVTR